MSSQNCQIPPYSEKREIECQTELEEDLIIDDGKVLEEEIIDGSYVVQLPEEAVWNNASFGEGIIRVDIADSVIAPPVLNRNEFTITSRRLLRHTKVITPSKFAEEVEKESRWKDLSQDYAKRVRKSTQKRRKIICKKPPEIVYTPTNTSQVTSSHSVQNINIFNSELPAVTSFQELNHIIPHYHNIGMQQTVLNIDPANNLDSNFTQFSQNAGGGTVQVINGIEGNKGIYTPLEETATLNTEPDHSFSQIHPNSLQTNKIEVNQPNVNIITPLPVPLPSNISITNNMQTETKITNVQKSVTKQDLVTLQVKPAKPVPKQQAPTLDLKKLIETLQSQGRDLTTLENLISRENGEIHVNGLPLKFIVVESSEPNLNNINFEESLSQGLCSTNNEDPKETNIQEHENNPKTAGDISLVGIQSVLQRKCDKIPTVTEIVEENLQNLNMKADQLNPDKYHEIVKEANKLIRTKETDNSLKTDQTRKYKCDICVASFKKSSNLSAHKRIHTNDKRFVCNICDKKFYVGTKLRAHMRIHTNTRPFECSVCKKSFRENAVLKNHMLTHTGEKQFQCELCEKKFFRKSKLDMHMKTHNDEKPYKCEHCGKSFAIIYYYRRHVKRHDKEKEFKCNKCGKEFHLKESYKFHLLSHDESKKKKCDICHKSFVKESQLKTHKCEPNYNLSDEFRCHECDGTFSSRSQLKIHLKEHKGEETYTCDICEKRFLHEYLLRRHKVVHSNEKPYKCKLCNVKFGWISSIRSHILKMHKDEVSIYDRSSEGGDKRQKTTAEDLDVCIEKDNLTCHFVMPSTDQEKFSCKECEKEFPESENDSHILHHKTHPSSCSHYPVDFEKGPDHKNYSEQHECKNKFGFFFCKICKEYVPDKEYETHTTKHVQFSYSCKICQKSFEDEQMLEIHKRSHRNKQRRDNKLEIPKIQCDTCKKEFPDSDFQAHMLVHVRYPFTCSFCYMNFESEEFLQKHLEVHKGDKPHRCNLCGEKFATLQLLTSHRKIHEEEAQKPKQCSDCGKRFRHNTDLKCHMRIHTGEKPHKCDECGESFVRKDYLTKHKRKFHDEGQKVKCSYCPKDFYNSYELTRHICLIHLKDKPFICDICDKTFSHHYALRKHVKSHEERESFKCINCPKTFSTKKLLNKHTKKEHADIPREFELVNKFISYTENEHGQSVKQSEDSVEKAQDDSDMDLDIEQKHQNDLSDKESQEKIEENFKCNICKSIVIKSLKESHLKLHKLFRCNICMEHFETLDQLTIHVNLHRIEKNTENPQSQTNSKIDPLEENIKMRTGDVDIVEEMTEDKDGVQSPPTIILLPDMPKSVGMKTVGNDAKNDDVVNNLINTEEDISGNSSEIKFVETEMSCTESDKGLILEQGEVEPLVEIPMEVFIWSQSSASPVEYQDPVTGNIYKILPPPKDITVENVMEVQRQETEENVVENEVIANNHVQYAETIDKDNQKEHSYVKSCND